MGEYHKNFDGWQVYKKELQKSNRIIYFHQREVWWCALGVNVGFEQDGKGYRYARPVIILKRYGKNACLVVPLTSQSKKGLFYFSCGKIDGRDAVTTVSQIRFIDQRRLIDKIDVIPRHIFAQLIKEIVRKNFL